MISSVRHGEKKQSRELSVTDFRYYGRGGCRIVNLSFAAFLMEGGGNSRGIGDKEI